MELKDMTIEQQISVYKCWKWLDIMILLVESDYRFTGWGDEGKPNALEKAIEEENDDNLQGV